MIYDITWCRIIGLTASSHQPNAGQHKVKTSRERGDLRDCVHALSACLPVVSETRPCPGMACTRDAPALSLVVAVLSPRLWRVSTGCMRARCTDLVSGGYVISARSKRIILRLISMAGRHRAQSRVGVWASMTF